MGYTLHGVEALLLLSEVDPAVAEALDVADELLALGDELLLTLALQLLAYVLPERLQELYLLLVLVVLRLYAFLLLPVLLVEAFDKGHEILLDEVLLLPHLQQQPLQFALDLLPVLAEQLDLVVELGQLGQDAVFILLVDCAQPDDGVPLVLSYPTNTPPNIPQSEQMASEQVLQKQVIYMRCSGQRSLNFSLLSRELTRCLISLRKRSQSAKLLRSMGLRQWGHSGLLSSIQVRRQFWQASFEQEGHIRGLRTFWKQIQHCITLSSLLTTPLPYILPHYNSTTFEYPSPQISLRTLSVVISSNFTPPAFLRSPSFFFLAAPPAPWLRLFITRFFILGVVSWVLLSFFHSWLRLPLKHPDPLPTSSILRTRGEWMRQTHRSDIPPKRMARSMAAFQQFLRLKPSTSALWVTVSLFSKVYWQVMSTISPGRMSPSMYSLLLSAFYFSSGSMTDLMQYL